MTRRISIYPGTFDPLTFGHIDIIERAARLGNQLIVAVAENSIKQPLFSVDERTEIVVAEVQEINKTTISMRQFLSKTFQGYSLILQKVKARMSLSEVCVRLLILNMSFKWQVSIKGCMVNLKLCF